jgi:DNA-binding CsgD family transcriptional regulator
MTSHLPQTIIHNDFQVQRFSTGIKLVKPTFECPDNFSYPRHSVANLFELPMCIHFSDSDNNISGINENTAEVCGFLSADDAIGKSMLAVSEKQSALLVSNNCNEVMITKKSRIFEENVMRKDEIINRCLSIKLPWYNSDNKIVGVFGCTVVLDKQPIATAFEKLIQLGFLESSILASDIDQCRPSIDHYKLSKRQLECLRYLMEGNSTKDIAKKLNLSPRTIEHYLDCIRKKFRCKSRVELIKKFSQIVVD